MVIVGCGTWLIHLILWLSGDAPDPSQAMARQQRVENACAQITGGFICGSIGIAMLRIWHQKNKYEKELEIRQRQVEQSIDDDFE